jgi:hypothetical protein
MARAAELLAQAKRPYTAPNRGIGSTVLAGLVLIGTLLFCQAVILRDINQMLIHQQNVAPGLTQ